VSRYKSNKGMRLAQVQALRGDKILHHACVYCFGLEYKVQMICLEIVVLDVRPDVSSLRCILLTSLAPIYIRYGRPRNTRVLVDYVGREDSSTDMSSLS
jgi:hypothetical protein